MQQVGMVWRLPYRGQGSERTRNNVQSLPTRCSTPIPALAYSDPHQESRAHPESHRQVASEDLVYIFRVEFRSIVGFNPSGTVTGEVPESGCGLRGGIISAGSWSVCGGWFTVCSEVGGANAHEGGTPSTAMGSLVMRACFGSTSTWPVAICGCRESKRHGSPLRLTPKRRRPPIGGLFFTPALTVSPEYGSA
jgi:hypothetical protein